MGEIDEKTRALGQRAVAAAGWRWEPGMLALADSPMAPERLTEQFRPNWPDEYDWPHDLGLRVPDLRDTATLGLLLGLVRAVYRDADLVGIYRAFHTGQSYVRIDREGGEMVYIHGSTVAEALVRALEHASPVTP
jgi:hypothetical protein